MRRFVIGYDPGGKDANGLAALEVDQAYHVVGGLRMGTASTVAEALRWVEEQTVDARIVALGIDTLTRWGLGKAGWRPADLWLKRKYPEITPSVTSPFSLFGAMSMNGAAFLLSQRDRFDRDGTIVTEAHPKVLYWALSGRKHDWNAESVSMTDFLSRTLGIDEPVDFGAGDHRFDAALALLVALRGASGAWTLDLHAIDGEEGDAPLDYCGETRFWWPDEGEG